jgi:putative hemolysin
LALLWRGIGEVLVRYPKYDQLIGPVSISASYNDISRRLMVSYLEIMAAEQQRARRVKGKNPPRERLGALESAGLLKPGFGVRQLRRLIADADATHQGIPVLLERYLELGGRVLSLSVDRDFGHCLDALVAVDVPRVPEAMLKRFLGVEGMCRYFEARSPN